MSVMNPGISMFFSVTVDSFDLGDWSKMSGLGMTITTTDRPESAMNFFQHHLNGAMVYDEVVLERPISPETGAMSRARLNGSVSHSETLTAAEAGTNSSV